MRENLLKYEFFFSENDVGLKFLSERKLFTAQYPWGMLDFTLYFFFYRVPLLSLNNPQKDF